METKEYKIRESGNSNIVTVPDQVLESLTVSSGEKIIYEIRGNLVTVKKAEEKAADFDTILNRIIDKYHDAIEELVER